ncbi:MAG: hypothetical protein R3C62_20570 [Chloroflexota bacterium]
MLYLHPPYYLYEGVPVMADYHDPRQFYYLPNRPKLAVDENGRPAIRLLIFRENLDEVPPEEEHAAGFLVFDTSLAWPEATLNKVAQKIQDDLSLDQPPRLAPLPYRSGSVRLMFLDKVTQPPPAEGEEPAAEPVSKWVPMLESSGVPSLYGENRAIFSAMLSKKAAALMLGAFEGFIPAGVIYDLEYVGLQRAFNVHVEADWEQVYHHISEKYAVDLVFVSINTAEIIDELEEKQLITFTASLEGVDEEGMEAEFKAVRKELEEFVLEKFFKPVTNPNQLDTDGGAMEGLQTARQIVNLIHHWPSAGYSRLELNMTQVRSLAVDYTMLKAVSRHIAPQAHLSLFFEDYNLTRDDVVTVVDGKDAMWEELGFDISANADFATDGIHAISTDVYYGLLPEAEPETFPVSWSFLLDAAQTRVHKAAWYNPEVGNNVRYRYTVHFRPEALPGPETAVSSGWREHNGRLLILSPRELYQTRQVEAQLVRGFPFDRYPQVHVHLRYVDTETGWVHEDAALLDETHQQLPFAFRARAGAGTAVSYRLTYLGLNGKRLEQDWRTTLDDTVFITDPADDYLTVRVLVAGNRAEIMNLIVDFKYIDDINNVREFGSIFIDQSNINQLHQWRVPLADPAQRRYWYSQMLIDAAGNVTQTGWMQAEKTTLPVGAVYAKVMEVQPELLGPPLAENGVERIRLCLKYHDAFNGYQAEQEMMFAAPGKGEIWRLELKDAGMRDYSYELTYVLDTGFEQHVGPFSSRDTFLLLSSVPPGQ